MIMLLINDHCELGENPLWRPEDGCLYWTDITGGKVHRFHLATREHRVIYSGETVGGFTFQEDGDLLLFRVRDIALLRKDGRVEVARAFSDEGMERFNDVIADPEGRVFAGTIGTTATSGGLYRVDRDGAITLLFRGTGCSNGMGFSPDRKTFYWTCSTRRRIYAFDYERSTGTLSGERVLYQAGEDEGIPDGMTVDANGHLWSARWDGFAVVHHAPDGSVVERFPFPVAKVSSLCLGGPDLDQFFVTTAGGKAGDSGEDGAVYQWSAGVRGRAEFKSRIFSAA
jgi:D-xylono/L-arabinono-1,4-lactonase